LRWINFGLNGPFHNDFWRCKTANAEGQAATIAVGEIEILEVLSDRKAMTRAGFPANKIYKGQSGSCGIQRQDALSASSQQTSEPTVQAVGPLDPTRSAQLTNALRHFSHRDGRQKNCAWWACSHWPKGLGTKASRPGAKADTTLVSSR
jgi:hypothetical protein